MIPLLFTSDASGGGVAGSVTTTKSGRNRRGPGFLPVDDDRALEMLLEAEDDDIIRAVMHYQAALKKVI